MTQHAALLEIAANSLSSAVAAQAGGAARIELCSALELGGLTPSAAQIALVRERLAIPVHVLVRPRAGDFVYSADEHRTMLADIRHCVAAGCDGVVVGALTATGDVDLARCRELVAAAQPLEPTFHRAIDMARDMFAALDDAIGLGFRRVLSSGGAATALAGAPTLRRMVAHAAGAIAIMPGAGIAADNIGTLARATGAREFHASASAWRPSPAPRQPGRPEGMADGELRTCEAAVRRLANALQQSVYP